MSHPIIIRNEGANNWVKNLSAPEAKALAFLSGRGPDLAIVVNPATSEADLISKLRAVADDIENEILETPLA